MRYVVVRFPNSTKEYIYKTKLSLIVGGIYTIVADNTYEYGSPVQIIRYSKNCNLPKDVTLREITKADCVVAKRKYINPFQKVIFNEKKGTTVVLWGNGQKTIVKCQEGDCFDKEKALAIAFMKVSFENRGYFNDYLTEALENAIEY